MTPEGKAKELVAKFMAYTLSYKDEFAAKQCALIAVEEVIAELELLRKPEYTTFIAWEQLKEKEVADTWDGYERKHFWQSVKEAINKL